MASIEYKNQDIKVSEQKTDKVFAYYRDEIDHIWLVYHTPDLKDLQCWRSWEIQK